MADPEFDATPCDRCGARCRCPAGKCHGTRYVEVQPGYAEQEHPDPDPDLLAPLDDHQRELLLWQVHLQRTAAANTVYPCRACAPAVFFRWVGKHFAADHDRGSCDECIEALGGRQPRRLSHAGIGPKPLVVPERKDLE